MEYKGFSDAAREMQAQTAEMTTKADKIRALAKAGYRRQQIADFLGIRYQHVRNVLIDDERRAKALGQSLTAASIAKPAVPAPAEEQPAESSLPRPRRTAKVKLGPTGELALPPKMLEELGWKEGETIWVHLEDAGEIRLQDVRALTRSVQAWARKINLGSVDEFLAERRIEAEREEREMQAWLSPNTSPQDG